MKKAEVPSFSQVNRTGARGYADQASLVTPPRWLDGMADRTRAFRPQERLHAPVKVVDVARSAVVRLLDARQTLRDNKIKDDKPTTDESIQAVAAIVAELDQIAATSRLAAVDVRNALRTGNALEAAFERTGDMFPSSAAANMLADDLPDAKSLDVPVGAPLLSLKDAARLDRALDMSFEEKKS